MFARIAAASLLVLSTAAAATLPDDYTVIEIFPGYSSPSTANAVSNTGIVVGCYGSSPATAFMWKDGQRTDLWTGCATAVNDNGVIVGYDSAGNVVLWNSGTLTQLGFQSYGPKVNNAGWVVGGGGSFVNNVYVQQDFLWHDGQLMQMPTGCSRDINNLNQVLCNNSSTGAGIWQDGTITLLPPPPSDSFYTWTNFPSATALTDRTQVVGSARGPIYYENGVTRRVFTMTDGGVVDMNSSLTMLGDEEGIYGFVTDPSGTIKYFANMPGPSAWHHMSPHGINEAGWVVGNATTGPSSSGESFVMIPKYAATSGNHPGQPVAGLPVSKRPVQDFNADNRGDLLWHSNDGQWGVWLMDGRSPIAGGKIAAPANASLVARGDFDGDGRGDLVFKDDAGAYWITLMNGTDASSTKVYDGSGGWSLLGVGDFNGDHRSDLLWYHPVQGFAVWLMNGATVAGGGNIPYLNDGWPAAIGDFDGDGSDDIAWMGSDGHHEVYAMHGVFASPLGTIRAAGTGFRPAFIADFDNDGRQDIVWVHPDGRASLWLVNGGTVKDSTSILDAGSPWHVIGTPDFDGSGTADLLFRNDDGSVGAWLMSGVTPIDGRTLLGAHTGWSVAQDIEISGDFKTDLVWRNVDGSYADWLMNGLGPTDGATLLPAGSGWELANK